MRNKWVTTLLIAISLLAVAVDSQYHDAKYQVVAQEQAGDQEEQETPTTTLSEAIQSANAQISLDSTNTLLDVVPQGIQFIRNFDIEDQFRISGSKSIKILLRRIISPNAP